MAMGYIHWNFELDMNAAETLWTAALDYLTFGMKKKLLNLTFAEHFINLKKAKIK